MHLRNSHFWSVYSSLPKALLTGWVGGGVAEGCISERHSPGLAITWLCDLGQSLCLSGLQLSLTCEAWVG